MAKKGQFNNSMVSMLKKIISKKEYIIVPKKINKYMKKSDLTGEGKEYTIKDGDEVIFKISYVSLSRMAHEYSLIIKGQQYANKLSEADICDLYDAVEKESTKRNGSAIEFLAQYANRKTK